MNRRAFIAMAAGAFVPTSAHAQAPPPSMRFGAAAAYSADNGGATFIVVRNGIVLAEHYPLGAHDMHWPIGAGTRMFAPILAASLVEDGLMSLDEPAAMTLGDWGAHPTKSIISIRGLMNGTSGIAFPRESAMMAVDALALEPQESPGARFIDDPAPFVLIAEIARRKLERTRRPRDPAQYLMERTLEPIGCAPVSFTRGPDGAALFYDGMAMSARAWAQAGELIRREGVWRAQQLVSATALREAMRGTFADARAGMGLWLNAAARPSDVAFDDSDLWRMNPPAPTDLAMAAGSGGARLFIIPSEGLVVVRQARDLQPRPWSDATFLSLIADDI